VTARRVPFLLVVVGLLVVALVAGNASAPHTEPPISATSAASLVSKPEAVWFCPGMPPTLPRAAGRITFANLGDTPAEVIVTTLPDQGRAAQQRLEVAPMSTVTRRRDQIGAPGALTIETFGGRIVVEEGVEANDMLASAPCATSASTRWYFAAGTTLRGVRQSLVIVNPYASDARVDLVVRTGTGRRTSNRLQSIDIARRTRVVVPLEAFAVREEQVGVEVVAPMGSVVASEVLQFTSEVRPTGVAWTVGSPATADAWSFAGGTIQANARTGVAITNHALEPAAVDIAVRTGPDDAIAPTTIDVAPDAVTWVQIGGCAENAGPECIEVPNNARYGLEVTGVDGAALVAQVLTRYDGTPPGITTALGVPAPARMFALARSAVSRQRGTTLAVLNPNAAPERVNVGIVRDGRIDRPPALQDVGVPPGRRVDLTVVGADPRTFGALLVEASGAVFVERSIVGSDELARTVAVAAG
jgi:hypothetical protein